MAILTLETANQFSSDDVVTSSELNELATTAKFVTGSSGATDDSKLTVDSSGRLTINSDGVTATELSMMNSSTGEFTLAGTAPKLVFDDSDNTGVDPTISNHGTGDLLLQAGANNKIIYLQTANSSGTLTNRLLIGATVSKDAGNNSSQSGVKIDGDIYATADISADGDVAASLASDIRLKENIYEVDVSPSGIKIYEFKYIDGVDRYRGVMAQDLLEIDSKHPAVSTDDNGFYVVDYDLLDVNMEKIS